MNKPTKITFNLPESENQILEEYCEQTGRNKTDVLREFIRSLKLELQNTDVDHS
jgi:hypothetical protein